MSLINRSRVIIVNLKICGKKNPTVNDIFANFKEIELFTTMNATKINTKNWLIVFKLN